MCWHCPILHSPIQRSCLRITPLFLCSTVACTQSTWTFTSPDDVHNQFPGRQPSPAQLNMSNNGCCNKSPACFCAICAILVIVLIAALCIPLATQFMDSDPTIPPGASGPIKIDKNLIGRMSLLDISQKDLKGKASLLQPGSFSVSLASPSSSPALAMHIISNVGFPGAELQEKLNEFSVNAKSSIQLSSRR